MVAKGFKNTEIGVIPVDWEVFKVKDIATIKTGAKNAQDRISNGLYPFFVRSQTIERINSYCFDGEAVLTAGDGVGVGKVFHYVNEKFDFHQRVYSINTFRAGVFGFYFFKYFQNNFLNRITQMTAKSSVDSVRMETISEMPIPLPPLAEQKAIAEALSDADVWIANLEQMIAKKRLIKQGTMQQLLSPKADWEVKKLGEVGKIYGGLSGKTKQDFGSGNSYYIPFMNVMKNVVTDKNFIEKVNLKQGETQNRVLKNDLLFNGSSETPEELGISSVLLEDIDNLYLNSFCFGFRIFDKNVSPIFLSYVMRSPYGREVIFYLAQGATRYNLSKANFFNLEIAFPKSLTEQTHIATILSDMDSEIESLENQLAKARQIKEGMMQELLTGRVRL